MTSTLPTISLSFDSDSGEWALMARSYGQTVPAGARLFRAEPWPEVKFSHEDRGAAEKDAATLRAYLERVWDGGPSKRRVREAGAD